MANNKKLPSLPFIEPLPTEQPGITTIPPMPLETTSAEVFDSNNNPDVKQYLSTSIKRPQGPRKSSSKSINQDLSSSASTAGTEACYVTTRNSPTTSQDCSDNDTEFRQRKKRPHSGVVGIDLNLTWIELAQRLSVATDQCNQLTKLNFSLERNSESDTAQIMELEDALKITRTAKNRLEPRTRQAEKELADLQETHHEIMSKNAKLEGSNKVLTRETTQAKKSEEKCRLLNSSMNNRIAMLKESVFSKENFINRLKEENANLMWDRDQALAAAQRAGDDVDFLASRERANQELRDENLILKREAEAVRSQLATFEDQQNELAEDLWKNEDAQTITCDRSNSPAAWTWNSMVGSQIQLGQELTYNPALTNALTFSTQSLTSPEPISLAAARNDLLKTINEVMPGNGDSLGRICNSDSGNQEETSGRVLEVQGLGSQVSSLAEELDKGAACVGTPSAHANTQTQRETSPTSTQQILLTQTLGNKLLVQNSTDLQSCLPLEQRVVEVQVEKPPFIDPEVQPSPRKVFEMMESVTMIDEEGIILPATTYVNRGIQARPNIYADKGVQKDAEHVEMLPSSLSEESAMSLPYTSRVRSQAFLKDLSETTIPKSSNTSTEKKEGMFNWWPSNSVATSVYKIVGPRPRYLSKIHVAGEDTTNPEVVVASIVPVMQDFAFEEHAENVETESAVSPALPSLPLGIRDHRFEHSSTGTSEESTNFLIEGNDSMRTEIGESLLVPIQDSGSQTGRITVNGPASLSVDAKQPQRFTFRNPVASVSTEPFPANFRQSGYLTVNDDMPSINNLASANTDLSPMIMFELPIGSEWNHGPDGQTNDKEAVRSRVAVKSAHPTWYHAGLGLMIMVFLIHTFAEKRFWRDANELTRRAVVSMRDERWGSDWVERMDYTISQQLSIDRTGFC